MTTCRFPEGFLWGAATAAVQIEGAPLADGAGPSIQHRFAHTPGRVPAGETDDVTADHYNRFREDVAIMGELGLRAYQFSVSWSRVLPEGTGAVNPRGLDFYDALVDALLEAGVAPVPVLYVWDLPAALQDRGGWANRHCADWFADYAALVFDRLGDRATHWLTICEPWSIVHAGHIDGGIAPSMRDLYAALRAMHHLLLAHGRAVQAFRASGAKGEIGTSSPAIDVQPASGSDADAAAAGRARGYFMDLYFDPVMRGEYPAEMVERFGAAWPEVRDGDLATISTAVDFLGVTYYVGVGVADGADDARSPMDWLLGPMGELLDIRLVTEAGPPPKGSWLYHPDGVSNVLARLSERYGHPPLYVTENGTVVSETEDSARIEFIRDHLAAAHRAIGKGVDLRGWFVWSLMDTWEFGRGFQAYGLVDIDYGTQRRTIRSSGYWYRDVIAANGFTPRA